MRKAIEHMLNEPFKNDPIITDWLRSETIEKQFYKIIDEVLTETNEPDSILLLKKAFTVTKDDEDHPLIDRRLITNVIDKLTDVLIRPYEHLRTIDVIASLTAYLSTIISQLPTETTTESYERETNSLIVAFFTFICNTKSSSTFDYDSYLSEDTLWEVRTSLQDVITTISRNLDEDSLMALTNKLAHVVETNFSENFANQLQQSVPKKSSSIVHLSESIVSFSECLSKTRPSLIGRLLSIFLRRNFALTLRENLRKLCTIVVYVRGHLTCMNVKDMNVLDSFISSASVDEDDVVRYFAWLKLCLDVVSSVIVDDEEDEDVDNDSTRRSVKFVELLDDPEEFLLDSLMDVCLMEILCKYKNVSTFSNFYVKVWLLFSFSLVIFVLFLMTSFF